MQATSYHTVLFCALAYKLTGKEEVEQADKDAHTLLAKFNETGVVPEYIESWCLDVLLGKIPIFNSKGKVMNRRKHA